MFEKLKNFFKIDGSPVSEEIYKVMLQNLDYTKNEYKAIVEFIEEFEKSEFLKNTTMDQAEKIARLISWNGRNGIDKLYYNKPKEGIK